MPIADTTQYFFGTRGAFRFPNTAVVNCPPFRGQADGRVFTFSMFSIKSVKPVHYLFKQSIFTRNYLVHNPPLPTKHPPILPNHPSSHWVDNDGLSNPRAKKGSVGLAYEVHEMQVWQLGHGRTRF